MTLGDPTNRSPTSADWPISLNDFDGIPAACRREPACRANHRTDPDLVEPNQSNHDRDGQLSDHGKTASEATFTQRGRRTTGR